MKRDNERTSIRISTTKFAPLFTEAAERRKTEQEDSSPRTFVKLFTEAEMGEGRAAKPSVPIIKT